MKQADLDRAVAHVTGETVSTIKRLGFLLVASDDCLDPNPDEYGPNFIDWDALESRGRDAEVPRHEPAFA